MYEIMHGYLNNNALVGVKLGSGMDRRFGCHDAEVLESGLMSGVLIDDRCLATVTTHTVLHNHRYKEATLIDIPFFFTLLASQARQSTAGSWQLHRIH